MTDQPILETHGLSRNFGGLPAVMDVSFATRSGEIFGIIGPNGAGKTTLFNLLTGALPPSSGRALYRGRDVTGLGMDQVARLGIVRTFQATTVFKRETVLENLRRAYLFGKLSRPLWLFRYTRMRESRGAALQRSQQVMEFTGLAGLAQERAGDLPYGLQKILGVGMAMAAEPQLMLMDEPAAGLNASETLAMGQLVRRLRDEGHIDIIIVEHDMKMIMSICDRILVLNRGRTLFVGKPEEVRAHPEVIDAYLGADLEFA